MRVEALRTGEAPAELLLRLTNSLAQVKSLGLQKSLTPIGS